MWVCASGPRLARRVFARGCPRAALAAPSFAVRSVLNLTVRPPISPVCPLPSLARPALTSAAVRPLVRRPSIRTDRARCALSPLYPLRPHCACCPAAPFRCRVPCMRPVPRCAASFLVSASRRSAPFGPPSVGGLRPGPHAHLKVGGMAPSSFGPSCGRTPRSSTGKTCRYDRRPEHCCAPVHPVRSFTNELGHPCHTPQWASTHTSSGRSEFVPGSS